MIKMQASWPKASIDAVYVAAAAPGAPFEMQTVEVRGVELRAYVAARRTLREIFETGTGWGDRDYLVYEGEHHSYAGHFRAAARLAILLSERFGVVKGDRVAIAMRNLPEWSLAFWATQAIGAVAVPLNAWGTGDDLAYGLKDSGARVVFADEERASRLLGAMVPAGNCSFIVVRSGGVLDPRCTSLEHLIGHPSDYPDLPGDLPPDPDIDTDDDATIFYTSGTTGRPKGAIGTHRNIATNLINLQFSAFRAAIRRGDPPPAPRSPDDPPKATLLALPLFHVTGTHSIMVPTVLAGGKLVLMHKWDPQRFLDLVCSERINSTSLVPAMAWQVVDAPGLAGADLSSLESLSCGGAAVPPELSRRLASVLPTVSGGQGYGATETSSVAVSNDAEDQAARPGSVGVAVPCVDLKVVGETGETVRPGEPGELCIKGPNVVRGYWGNAEASRAAFADGWYRTGDIVRMDEDGFVFLLDRAKDMVIRGGENIYCAEIENVLAEHEAIAESAVIALPHDRLGEEVGAVIRLRPGSDPGDEALRCHCAARMAAHKIPVAFYRWDGEFPRTASGKTIKLQVREAILTPRSDTAPSPLPMSSSGG